MRRLLLLGSILACRTSPDVPGDTDVFEAFPRCAAHDEHRRPWFGDLHVHTALSLDAALQGTRLRPADAYAFAKGATVGLPPYDDAGEPLRTAQLGRPLDFAAVTDHAEFLGTVALCTTPGSAAYDRSECRTYRESPDVAYLALNGLTSAEPDNAAYPALCGEGAVSCRDAGVDVWGEVRDAAEAAYDRTDACTFTSFVGFEWSGGPATRNLHRNVLFRTDAVPDMPTSYFDEPFVDGLWDRLDDGCLTESGCDVITIPHNANLSSGLMFETPEVAEPGYPEMTAERAARRARMEPLVEVYQHKGEGECWPGSPAADELCDFEKVPWSTLAEARLQIPGDPQPNDFLRDVLGEGFRWWKRLGVDPYLYGMVGGTDTHVGLAGNTDEQGFPGHAGAGSDHRDALPRGFADYPTFSPGGLSVLWAEENGREALFRAMRRREAYATSGTRIVLRVHAGRGDPTGLCDAPDPFARGDAFGVPMGADLPDGDGPPSIFAWAEADAGTTARPGTGLQHLQLVKGWLDGDAVRTEVIDLATARGAPPSDDCGGGGGVPMLCATWTDPSFDADVPAFWYVRAIEAPSCRWTTLACRDAGITCPTDDPDWAGCCDPAIPTHIQERAWSSPIWHVPG